MALPVFRVFLPNTCSTCGAAGPAPCASCWRLLRPAPPGVIPAGLDRCRALLAYEGVGRELLARLKYRNARSPLQWLAGGMAGLVRDPAAVDVVTWAPTTRERARRRGFDQAELLARAVAGQLGLPYQGLLRRRPGPPQTGRTRAERWTGPTFVPLPVHRGPGRVLIVDDLLTTGATLSAAAAALRMAGATSVMAVTAGRTPLKVTPASADP